MKPLWATVWCLLCLYLIFQLLHVWCLHLLSRPSSCNVSFLLSWTGRGIIFISFYFLIGFSYILWEVGWSLVNLSFSFRTPSTSSYLLFIFFLLVSCLFAKKKKNKHPKKQERRRRRQKTTNRGNENEWSVGCFLFIFITNDNCLRLWKRHYMKNMKEKEN